MMQRLGTAIIVLAIAAGTVVGRASISSAKDSTGKVTGPAKVAKGKKPASPSAIPAGVTVNACGCYRTEAGACFCGDKNGQCACPGDCEPMGCEQKRTREIQREVAAETKKAQEEEKRQEAAEAAAQQAADRGDAGSSLNDKSTGGESGGDESAESVEKKADEPKPDKRGPKGRKHATSAP